MQRWDFIQKKGKSECAKAIAFWFVKAVNKNISCEELTECVKLIQPTIEDWLSDKIEMEE